jgi:multidrug transporter EmrE-like cation transporter
MHLPTRLSAVLHRLGAPLAIAAGAVLLRLIGGAGFANYDTLYALAWGQQLDRGQTPSYGIPIAPTPHPLVEALGALLAPLGPRATEDITVALGLLALSACAWAVYRLGALWFNRPAGALAALLLITRVPILSYGVRAYVDLPYLLLVLGALIVESRRSRAGVGVLALLGLAGLLRPEAWVFSGLYWLYLVVGNRGLRSSQELAWLALAAVAAPLIWVVSDWLVTGDPLWSLTNTRHTAQTLGRKTGIGDVPQYIPRRIGEILGPAVLAGAAFGGVLSLLWLRRRALAETGMLAETGIRAEGACPAASVEGERHPASVGAVAGVVAVAVFAAFATAGLPIDTRYAFLAGAILCVFCGAGLCGWLLLEHKDPRRRWWMLGAALLTLVLLASAPAQYRTAHREFDALGRQQRIQNDLLALVNGGAIAVRCEPIGVPNHAPIPLLALWLKSDPNEIVSAQVRQISGGTYVGAADAEVQHDYILDPDDPHPRTAVVPPGFTVTQTNRSWVVYKRCPP